MKNNRSIFAMFLTAVMFVSLPLMGSNTTPNSLDGHKPRLVGSAVLSKVKKTRERKSKNSPAFTSEIAKESVEVMKKLMPAARAQLRQKIGADEIVFIKRFPYRANHYYTEYLNGAWLPGGGIFVLSLNDGTERQIATELKGGVFGRMDVSFDAEKIVFDWKRSKDEGYRIYEIGVDGSGLRQVLEAPADEAEVVEKYRLKYHHGSDDMHPCYLPDGGFAFTSTRCRTGTLCNGPDAFTTTVLYRMDGDGSNLKQLSFGALSEFTPALLPDGRIIYSRWEYVDKGAVAVKCIWAMRPDGTESSEIYGNDIQYPSSMIQARAIPNAPNQYVILGCPHFPQNGLGTVVRLDMNKPIRTTEPMTYMTPYVKVLAEGGWHFPDADGQMSQDKTGSGPLFRDPYPLSEDLFMVAHKPRGFGTSYQENGYGLYLLDAAGEVMPFYVDPQISCWQPMPVKLRTKPPVLAGPIDPKLAEREMATCLVTDVYHGLEGVERGSIRHIRVLEQVARPWSARRFDFMGATDLYDQQHAVVSKDTALGLKIQHGVVPVEEDGSAHFLVPAKANIFFQVLDKHYLSVQTERTFVNFMPGEVRSCIGCHETPKDALPTVQIAMAFKREPSLPSPQPGENTGNRPLHYPSDVQPVLDQHCIECHNSTPEKKGGLDLTGTMTTLFSASYENLIMERRGGRNDRREPGLVPTIGENHPKTGNVEYLPARSLGSHNSLLMAMLMPNAIQLTGDKARMERLKKLREVHKDLALTKEELLKISNWVDTNAQYYGSYYGRRNIKDKGHPNFRPVPSWDSARGIPPLPDEKR